MGVLTGDMRIVSEKNIAKVSFLYAIIIVGVMTFSTGALFIAKKFNTLKKDLVKIEQDFIAQQEEELENDVADLVGRIDHRRLDMEKILQQRLKQRVAEALVIADNIYETMHEGLSSENVANVIREAIRPIRFNEQQGYFFILSLEGKAILYPTDSQVEGTNFLTNGAGGDPDAVREIIRISQEEGGGFHRYDWTKPGDNSGNLYQKVSYVGFFEPLGWVIGTGEYLDNLEHLAKTTITNDLAASLKKDLVDYYFIYELHDINGGKDFATMLVNSNRPDLVGKRLSDDYKDAKGKLFRKEFLKGIRETGEANVVYWYKKPNDSAEGRKLSYFKHYPVWNWVLARGIYLDRLDEIIAAKKGELSGKVKNDIIILCILFVGAVVIALIVAYYFSRGLQEIFNRYRNTQQEHLDKLEELNKALEKQSQTDVLTKIFNRRFFNMQLAKEAARSTRHRTPLSVLMFDIDHFKAINDEHGHLIGDKVLQEISALVQDNIRQSDFLARWGGEEFALLTPGVGLKNAGKFAEKLRCLIEKNAFCTEQEITCSFGVSCYQTSEETSTFIQRADQALYQAKNSGRNCCVIL